MLTSISELPIEIRILILDSLPDTSTLRNLLLCHSTYHDAYHSASSQILRRVLESQYTEAMMGEALLSIRAKGLYNPMAETRSERRNQVINLLDRYRRDAKIHHMPPSMSDAKAPGLLDSQISIEELQQIAHLLAVVDACMGTMATDFWSNAYKPQRMVQQQPLSKHEKYRFRRAICRYNAYCTLFGARELPRYHWAQVKTFDEDFGSDQPWLFFLLFSRWQIQEILCIYDYVDGVYELKEGVDDIYDGSMSDEEEVPRGHRRRDSDEQRQSTVRDTGMGLRSFLWRERLNNVGVQFLHKAWRQETPEHRHHFLSCQIMEFYEDLITVFKMSLEDGNRRLLYPAELFDEATVNEHRTCLPDVKRHNIAWNMVRHSMDEDHAASICDECRPWGFVFWDNARLLNEDLEFYRIMQTANQKG